MTKDILVAIAGLVAVGILWAAWMAFSSWRGDDLRPFPYAPVACTEEAKLCPDGSSVGRTGPRCEFPPCP